MRCGASSTYMVGFEMTKGRTVLYTVHHPYFIVLLVAVLLPVGERDTFRYFKNRRLEKCTHAVQIVANLPFPIK